MERCARAEDPFARIAACTEAIDSGRFPGAAGAWAFSNRGAAHAALNNPLAAFDDHDRAVALDPGDATVLNNRGNSHAEFGHWDRALADYDRAIRLRPGYAVAHFNRAGARLKTGDAAGAAEDYARVLALRPELTVAHLGVAEARCRQGEVAASLAARRAALDAGAMTRAALEADLRRKGWLRDGDTDAALAAWTAAGCP